MRLIADNNLNWMHTAISQARWRCTARAKPRAWELEIEFWVHPFHGGPIVLDGCVVCHKEVPGESLTDHRIRAATEFKQGREFLHMVTIQAAQTGIINGTRYYKVRPVTVKRRYLIPGDKRDDLDREFDRMYDLNETDPERFPGEWILRCKETGLQVLFTVEPGASPEARKEAAAKAIYRMRDLRAAIQRSKEKRSDAIRLVT